MVRRCNEYDICDWAPRTTFTYSFDSLGRVNGLTDNWNVTWLDNMQYGPAGQLTQMRYTGLTETRQYNSMVRLTRLTVPGVRDMEYGYSATQNNGRITQSKDWRTGEEVTYMLGDGHNGTKTRNRP